MQRATRPVRSALDRLRRSHFVRQVAVVAGGSAGVQLITLAVTPLITRLYGPAAFGELGTFSALLAVVVPVAALTYPIAIVLPRKDRDAVLLAQLSVCISVLIAALTALAIGLGGDSLAALLGAEAIDSYLMLLPLGMLFSALSQVGQQWLLRHKHFKQIAITTLAHSVCTNAAKTLGGLLQPSGGVLIAVSVVGYLIQAGLTIGIRQGLARPAQAVPWSWSELTRIARRHSDFALYRAPQDFINAISQGLPVLMLASLFGPAAAGFYALGRMAMGAPSMLLGKAIGDVFYPRIIEASRRAENVQAHIARATKMLFLVGVLPFSFVAAFGPDLFAIVFGDAWRTAGDYARWLAPFMLLNMVNKPSVAAVPVLGLQRGLLIYEVFSTGSKAVALALGFLFFKSDIAAVALFSASGTLAYIALIIWIHHCAQHHQHHEKAG